MKKMRSHIIRLVVTLLICGGFGISLVQPVQAKYAPDAFASWLSAMAKSSNSSDLQQDLEDLRKSREHLDQVIKKASYLIKNNNENFAFSYAETMAFGQLYQLLLIEWNDYQTGNGMSSTPVRQVIKSAGLDKVQESFVFGGLLSVSPNDDRVQGHAGQIDFPSIFFNGTVVPMADGIAIGAP